MYYLQYQSVFYSDVSMLIGYQHKKIGGSTISKRQQSGFEDGEAHTCGTVLSSTSDLSLPTSDQKKTILDIGVQMVTMDLLRCRQTGGTGFRQFVQSVSCDIIVKLYFYYRNYGVTVLTEWHDNFYKQQYPNGCNI